MVGWGIALSSIWIGCALGAYVTKEPGVFVAAVFGTLFVCMAKPDY